MAHLDTNRVLCRQGARELTRIETEFVQGAALLTFFCTFPGSNVKTQTHTGDAECSDTDSDS